MSSFNEMSINLSEIKMSDAILSSREPSVSFQSIATYARIKPTTLSSTMTSSTVALSDDFITLKTSQQMASDGSTREILEVDIPTDADPGLMYNNHTMDNGSKSIKYEFDKVFDMNAKQEDVFNVVARDRVKDALYRGINCSILAYGQTGSGKTYSICGGDAYADRGLIPRTISMIYHESRQNKGRSQEKSQTSSSASIIPEHQITSLRCQITFVEIYKDVIYDLLPPSDTLSDDNTSPNRSMSRAKAGDSLPIVQMLDGPSDGKGANQLVLKNINVYEAVSEEDALSLYFLGMKYRNTSSTTMNISSSRSHAVFTAIIETESIQDNKKIMTRGKINLVDLAGSERVYKKSSSRTQIAEAKSINLSLHYLEQVIVALRSSTSSSLNALRLGNTSSSSAVAASKDKEQYIPYRNSVLTTLLRDSLGGNCRSCFLFTLSSEREHLEESLSTSRFAQRCGEIKLSISANAEVDLRDQIKDLSARLKAMERHSHFLEEQKQKLLHELEAEKIKRKRLLEPRTLTAEDKYQCKACVQNLLAAAKETLESTSSTVNSKEMSAEERQHMLEASQDRLYNAVETMDKSVLVELCVALGGLVQTLYIEREKVRQQLSSLNQRLANDHSNKSSPRVTDSDKLTDHHSIESLHKNIIGRPSFGDTTQDGTTIAADTKLSSASMGHHLIGIDLPDATVHMLVNGAAFIKHCRFGRLKIRYVSLSPDLMNICWREIGNMQTQKTVSLKDYDRAEIDSKNVKGKGEGCLISMIRINPSERNLLIEYAVHETIDENRHTAEIWIKGLNKCIDRSKSVANSHINL